MFIEVVEYNIRRQPVNKRVINVDKMELLGSERLVLIDSTSDSKFTISTIRSYHLGIGQKELNEIYNRIRIELVFPIKPILPVIRLVLNGIPTANEMDAITGGIPLYVSAHETIPYRSDPFLVNPEEDSMSGISPRVLQKPKPPSLVIYKNE